MNSTLNPYFYAYNPELLAFENAWVDYVKNNQINTSVIRKEISDSWLTCREIGLDPLNIGDIHTMSEAQFENAKSEKKELLETITPFMGSLNDIALGTGFRIVFADEKGRILKSVGDAESLVLCNKTQIIPGADLSVNRAGTNGIGLSILLGEPVQISGAEHYFLNFHRIACSAAPIIDNNDQILGVLAVIGRYETIHRHTLGMVATTAEAIRNRIHIQKINEKLAENNVQLNTLLDIITDGVVYVKNGIVTELNNEMQTFLGKPAKDIIGNPVEKEIITVPSLEELLTFGNKTRREGEIVLKGKKRSFQCIFDVKEIVDESSGLEVGQVIIFTRVEEIQMLARKIRFKANFTFDDIIGESEGIKEAMGLAKRASNFDARVLIEGESGTGKEMFAQAIHNNSSRSTGPFIAVDCSTIPKELLESQLFGYEKGAFTGASEEGKIGFFELSNNGTVFLDEIGNMTMDMQIKLLRVLQEGVFNKVGGTKLIHTDVRIIAATNADLDKEIEKGKFRHDLYYRLNVIHIKTPPLRERKGDIPLLVEHFLNRSSTSQMRKRIGKKAMGALENYDWPGNIRQLSNAIERAVIMSSDNIIKVEDLPFEVLGDNQNDEKTFFGKPMSLQKTMKEYARFVLNRNNQNISKTSEILDISRTTLYKLLKDDDEAQE